MIESTRLRQANRQGLQFSLRSLMIFTLVASLLLLFARGGEQINQWRTLPWYMLCCGGFGLVLYLAISHTVPKLGAGSAITLIVVGQLLAGIVIDHFGAFDLPTRDFDPTRVLAVALLLAGAYLMVR